MESVTIFFVFGYCFLLLASVPVFEQQPQHG